MTAPFAGTIASVNLTVGQQVSGSGSTSGGTGSGSGSGGSAGGSGSGGSAGGGVSSAVAAASTSSDSSSAQIVLIDPVHFTISATVDDTAVDSVKTGQQARSLPTAAPRSLRHRQLSRPDRQLDFRGDHLPGDDRGDRHPGDLYPGASATVTLIVKQLSDVLAMPTAALHYTFDREGHRVVGGGKVETP